MKEKLKIVKIGGNVINDPVYLQVFLQDFARLEGLKILVHGGGKKATELSESLGIKTKMINGRRITDEAGLDVVTMVYAGLLNKKIVAGLQKYNCDAVGLSGADGNSIKAHKREVKEVDYGFAGDVDEVSDQMILTLINAGFSPVFCAITHDKKGQLLNTNADTIASELAKALSSKFQVELVYCFEKDGVLTELDDDSSIIEFIDKEVYAELLSKGLIAGGMLPKLSNCFDALEHGVSRVLIGRPELIRETSRKHTLMTL